MELMEIKPTNVDAGSLVLRPPKCYRRNYIDTVGASLLMLQCAVWNGMSGQRKPLLSSDLKILISCLLNIGRMLVMLELSQPSERIITFI